jgi:hypothetical protein
MSSAEAQLDPTALLQHAPEQAAALEGNIDPELAQRLAILVVTIIGKKAPSVIENENDRGNIVAEMKALQYKLTKASSLQDIRDAFSSFFDDLGKISTQDGIYRFINITRVAIDNVFPNLCNQSIQAPNGTSGNKESDDSKGSWFFNTGSMMRNFAINSGLSAAALFGKETFLARQQALDAIAPASNFAFGFYTLYMALLLSAAEGKATRAALALDQLAGAIVTFAGAHPETCEKAKQVLVKLRSGIEKEGKFEIDSLLHEMETMLIDPDEQCLVTMMGDIKTQLYSLREACRSGVSGKTMKIVSMGGGVVTLLSALYVANPVAAGALILLVAGAVCGIRDLLQDLDHPSGQGAIVLSMEPIEEALRIIDYIENEVWQIQRGVIKKIDEQLRIDQGIVNSFYKDFRAIFDPWYKAQSSFDQASRNIPTIALSTRASLEDNRKQLRQMEDEIFEGVYKPEFLTGNGTKEAGALDMNRQLSFRYLDHPDRQLALLEAVLSKVRKELNGDERAKAEELIRDWMDQVILVKEKGEKVTPKENKEVISHAVEALFNEIKSNIENEGDSRYVFARKAGSKKLKIETANRRQDWEEENIDLLLTPIHKALIERLQQAAIRAKDAKHAEKYHSVMCDITNVREEQSVEERIPVLKIEQINVARQQVGLDEIQIEA